MVAQRSPTDCLPSLLSENLRDPERIGEYLPALSFELPPDEWDLETTGFPRRRLFRMARSALLPALWVARLWARIKVQTHSMGTFVLHHLIALEMSRGLERKPGDQDRLESRSSFPPSEVLT